MLSRPLRQPRHLSRVVRGLATESVSHSTPYSTPPPPPLHPNHNHIPHPHKPRSRVYPQPRIPTSPQHLSLPPTFGRNQLLPVADSTRALLESIVAEFDAPIRYAFAYGSGVFEQDGYQSKAEKPMLDFMFAVRHPAHWHSINMQQHPSHYSMHSRLFGSSYVSRVQEISPGIWFNAYVEMKGVTVKYGVTTVDNLCSDLLNWRTLYLAGRMHKPLRIIKDDARVRLTQQVNLTSAVRVALLTLPESFSETELFETITRISYAGDPRMMLPAENRGKVGNIVRKQGPQFKELYHRLVTGLPGVHWPMSLHTIQQDVSPHARAALLRKLPSNLLTKVKNNSDIRSATSSAPEDDSAYWIQLASHDKLGDVLTQEMNDIVRYPATVQSVKGVVSAGLGKSVRYSAAKVRKWWEGGPSKNTSSSS